MVKLVTYDLVGEPRIYENLFKVFHKYPNAKITESCWLLRTDLTDGELLNMLLPCIDSNDRLFVTTIDTANWAGELLSTKSRIDALFR